MLIEVRDAMPIGQAIEEILVALFASLPGELANMNHENRIKKTTFTLRLFIPVYINESVT